MKTYKHKFKLRVSKQLLFKAIVISGITFATSNNLNNKNEHVQLATIQNDKFSNFDKVSVSNKPPVIAKMISILKPRFGMARRYSMATKIHQAFVKYRIEPQIVLAIIDTESSFNHEMVSSTGDLSLAQVNVDIWNKEFNRMKLELIDVEKLKADQAYSLEVMAQILNILKTRYGKKDRRWYARYHSKTEKNKVNYLAKLEIRMKLLEKTKLIAFN
jgi:hypothetical protein